MNRDCHERARGEKNGEDQRYILTAAQSVATIPSHSTTVVYDQTLKFAEIIRTDPAA
jgi:hypothetical protein